MSLDGVSYSKGTTSTGSKVHRSTLLRVVSYLGKNNFRLIRPFWYRSYTLYICLDVTLSSICIRSSSFLSRINFCLKKKKLLFLFKIGRRQDQNSLKSVTLFFSLFIFLFVLFPFVWDFVLVLCFFLFEHPIPWLILLLIKPF